MHYGEIKLCDIANGEGVRVSLFVSGCRNHCEGCFQPETWNFNYGEEFTHETEEYILKNLKPDWVDGLSLLGGDPMEPENQSVLLPFLRKVKSKFPSKTVWMYTGYTYEDIKNYTILKYVDVLVDGKFIEEEKDISLQFCGSRNQRIIRLNNKNKY